MNRNIIKTPKIITAALAMLLGWIPTAHASVGVCVEGYDRQTDYPQLPASSVLDVSGQPVITIYVDDQRMVIDVDGCLYTIADELLEVDLGIFDEVVFAFVFTDLVGGEDPHAPTIPIVVRKPIEPEQEPS